VAYPYDWIETFWGESLCPELNARIEAARAEHIAAFAQANDHINFDDPRYFVPPLEPLPKLPRGQLRPVMVQSALLERCFADGKQLMAELTTAMLLYAHQAVLPDVSDLLTAESGKARRFAPIG
jgi:hypothetical protein